MTRRVRQDAPIDDEPSHMTRDDCSYYGRGNGTGFGLIRAYEGIPENILVNVFVSTVRPRVVQPFSPIDRCRLSTAKILVLVFVYVRRRCSDSKNVADGNE
jgi:hypothetical protein